MKELMIHLIWRKLRQPDSNSVNKPIIKPSCSSGGFENTAVFENDTQTCILEKLFAQIRIVFGLAGRCSTQLNHPRLGKTNTS